MLLRDSVGGFNVVAHLLESAEHNLSCFVVDADPLEAYICHGVKDSIITLFRIIATKRSYEAALTDNVQSKDLVQAAINCPVSFLSIGFARYFVNSGGISNRDAGDVFVQHIE